MHDEEALFRNGRWRINAGTAWLVILAPLWLLLLYWSVEAPHTPRHQSITPASVEYPFGDMSTTIGAMTADSVFNGPVQPTGGRDEFEAWLERRRAAASPNTKLGFGVACTSWALLLAATCWACAASLTTESQRRAVANEIWGDALLEKHGHRGGRQFFILAEDRETGLPRRAIVKASTASTAVEIMEGTGALVHVVDAIDRTRGMLLTMPLRAIAKSF